ncbi:MAG: HNH endonuclease [Proteobacteria bacterium]|nr:HNH endonuclease [Pseudomonadota bacterium]
MARSVSEWIGRSDDHRAPGKVRQKVFDREKGKCHLCEQPIQAGQKWDLDHVKALINGGENRDANLKPAHRKCHKDKTARDVAEKAKVAAIRQRHLGITVDAPKLQGRPFPKSTQAAKRASREAKTPLQPKRLFDQVEARNQL